MDKMLIIEENDAMFRDIEDALGEDLWVGRARNFDEAWKFFEGNPDIELLAINTRVCGVNIKQEIERIREIYKYPILCYGGKKEERKKLTKKGVATHQTSIGDIARYSKILLDVMN